jgi:tRNA (guanine26-N2/guanine27-N2)-dimethyltransferase
VLAAALELKMGAWLWPEENYYILVFREYLYLWLVSRAMIKKIKEANTIIEAPVGEKISAKLPVFYNPVMKFNRDISVLLLSSVENKEMQVCDLLAGTGIRSVRFLSELPKEKICSITINDYNKNAAELIKKNILLNKLDRKVKDEKIELDVTNSEANLLLMNSTGFDYIDVDPFGTPNPFLENSCRRISRNGIIAVTATDTSALAGTFPKTCMRKYWAKPDRGPLKHELGLRILIRKVQLIGAQYEKALVPIFSYSKEHYMRVFFRCIKGKERCDEVLQKHGVFKIGESEAGPLWLGELWDESLVEKMYNLALKLDYEFDIKFLKTILDESRIKTVGFYDIHNLCKKNKLEVPQFERICDELKKRKFVFSRTHFCEFGIKSNVGEEEMVGILKTV